MGGGGYILTGGGLWWMVVDGDRWLWMVVGGGIVQSDPIYIIVEFKILSKTYNETFCKKS